MNELPDAAIEAAAEAMCSFANDAPAIGGMEWFRNEARAAIEAAMPAIRETIAQELDPDCAKCQHAARIVRGGTP